MEEVERYKLSCEVRVSSVGLPLVLFQDNFKPYTMNIHEAIRHAINRPNKFFDLVSQTVAEFVKESVEIEELSNKYKLSYDETCSICYYSCDARQFGGKREDSPFYILNQILSRRNIDQLAPWQNYLYYFISALQKLPKVERSVYRALDQPLCQLSKQYQRGKTVVWVSFTSTSLSRDVINSFMDTKNQKGTFILLKVIEGIDISPFSLFSYEKELLLLPNSVFTVQDILTPEMKELLNFPHQLDGIILQQKPTPPHTLIKINENMDLTQGMDGQDQLLNELNKRTINVKQPIPILMNEEETKQDFGTPKYFRTEEESKEDSLTSTPKYLRTEEESKGDFTPKYIRTGEDSKEGNLTQRYMRTGDDCNLLSQRMVGEEKNSEEEKKRSESPFKERMYSQGDTEGTKELQQRTVKQPRTEEKEVIQAYGFTTDEVGEIIDLVVENHINDPRWAYVSKDLQKRRQVMKVVFGHTIRWCSKQTSSILVKHERNADPYQHRRIVAVSVFLEPNSKIKAPIHTLVIELGRLFYNVGPKVASRVKQVIKGIEDFVQKNEPENCWEFFYLSVLPEYINDREYWEEIVLRIFSKADRDRLPVWTYFSDFGRLEILKPWGFTEVISGSLIDTRVPMWGACRLPPKTDEKEEKQPPTDKRRSNFLRLTLKKAEKKD